MSPVTDENDGWSTALTIKVLGVVLRSAMAECMWKCMGKLNATHQGKTMVTEEVSTSASPHWKE